jgi:hypothetical protein
MSFSLDNSLSVFIFIILCSIYVCSILWVYGDAATRGMAGLKGAFTAALVAIVIWPLGVIVWLCKRPSLTGSNNG